MVNTTTEHHSFFRCLVVFKFFAVHIFFCGPLQLFTNLESFCCSDRLDLISATVPAGLRIQDSPHFDQDANFQPSSTESSQVNNHHGASSSSSSSSRVMFVLPATSPNVALVRAWARLPFGLPLGEGGRATLATAVSGVHAAAAAAVAAAATDTSGAASAPAMPTPRFSTPGASPLTKLLSTCTAAQLAAQVHAIAIAAASTSLSSDCASSHTNSSASSSSSTSSTSSSTSVSTSSRSTTAATTAIIRETAEVLTEWATSLEPAALAALATGSSNIVHSSSPRTSANLLARLPLLLAHFMKQQAQDVPSNQVRGRCVCTVNFTERMQALERTS